MSSSQAGSETLKTLLFVSAAVATLLVAFMTRPTKLTVTVDDEIDKPLFPELSSNAANGLEVLSFNEELGEMKQFKVAQQEEGLWVIPSHQSYPADAQLRLLNAATMFVDLNVIAVVSEQDSEHATFGVIEPSVQETRVGDEGVGTLVTVSGKTEDGQTKLASLIIGKPVKGVTGQHYVRRPGKSRVYQVKIDPSQLSTRFQDWIETDLLKLDPQQVAGITIKDYSTQTRLNDNMFEVIPENRMELQANVVDGGWAMDSFQEFARNGEIRSTWLEEGEQLNASRLNTLRNALGDLKIVDVERKPKGLEADLQAANDLPPESIASLASRGFFAFKNADGSIDVKCSDGELIIDTQDGIRYQLRFGQIAGIGEQTTAAESGEQETSSSVNRYMFVSVSVNESQFPEPEMEPLPEGAEALENAADAPAGTVDNELAIKVERIKKAYQRKVDERSDQIEAAKAKVSQLSYRFADWYYVVSDDVFKKLRLRRSDVIGYSQEALRTGTGIQAFKYLKKLGLKADPDTVTQ